MVVHVSIGYLNIYVAYMYVCVCVCVCVYLGVGCLSGVHGGAGAPAGREQELHGATDEADPGAGDSSG